MTGFFCRSTRPGTAGAGILLLLMLGWGFFHQAHGQDVDAAMQAFIQAMVSKNPDAIFAAFSRQSPWRYQPYEIGTGKRLQPEVVSPQKLALDIQEKKGWYDFFLADPNGYTFRVNFIDNKAWKKRGAHTFVAPDSTSGHTYLKWRQEGQSWVIAEIGETTA